MQISADSCRVIETGAIHPVGVMQFALLRVNVFKE
jgi:hypothetical protein